MRPVQSRMQTGMQGAQFSGIGMNANIKVVNRPVTNHGVSGMQAKQVSEERQVVNRGFVITELREKCTSIYEEIEKFKSKMDNMGKETTLYQNLDKKFEELTKEVRELEGKLADYNLSFDKQRAGTRPEEIRNMYEHIKAQNDRKRQSLDEIFIERKNQEEQIQAIETQLNEMNELAQQKIGELLPEQRSEYESLLNENKQLGMQINNSRQELEEINQKLVFCENKLRMDSHKLKGQMLKEQIADLDTKKNDLELQLNEANLPFDQARDRLLARIKEDTSFIQTTDKRIREIQKNITNYEKRLRELGNEENNAQSAEEQKKKYEAIFEKDKEFNEFFESYDQQRAQDLEQLHQIESGIIDLLEKSSKYLAIDIPSDVSSDQLKKMQQEYRQKQDDVQKLKDAEERVDREMNTLRDKLCTMKDDISLKYDKADTLKRDLENKKRNLEKKKEDLKEKKDLLYQDIRKVKFDHDVKEKKMTMSEMYPKYTEAENKMIQLEKDVESLKTFIITKAQDMDYQALSEECKLMANELNNKIVKTL